MKWICVLAVSAALAQQPAPPPAPPAKVAPVGAAPSAAASVDAASAGTAPAGTAAHSTAAPAGTTVPAGTTFAGTPPAKPAPKAEPASRGATVTAAPVGTTAPAGTPPLNPAPKAEPAGRGATVTAAEAMRLSIKKQREAVEKQREAIRKQAESAGAWLRPGDPPRPMAFDSPLEADCEPLGDAVMAPLIETNAKEQEVKPELLRAVIERESGYRPCAVSSKGAQGLMQLMPETSQELGVKDPFDPKENVTAGAKFLKQLVDKYQGDLSKALGAYNAGPAAVDQAGGVPEIPETKDYVDAILKKLAITPPVPPSIPTPKPIGN